MFTCKENKFGSTDVLDENGVCVSMIENGKVEHIFKGMDSSDLRKLGCTLEKHNTPYILELPIGMTVHLDLQYKQLILFSLQLIKL